MEIATAYAPTKDVQSRLGVSRWTVARRRSTYRQALQGQTSWTPSRAVRSDKLGPDIYANISNYMQRPTVATVSPHKAHVIKVQGQPFSWHFMNQSTLQTWRDYCAEFPDPVIGLRKFYEIIATFKWLKRTSHLDMQKSSCVCSTCSTWMWLLKAYQSQIGPLDTDMLLNSVCCSEVTVCCAERRCTSCPKWPVVLENAASEKHITWKHWQKETYTAKTGGEKRRTVIDSATLPVLSFLKVFHLQGQKYINHRYKFKWLGEQRQKLWCTDSSDWLVCAHDWSSDYVKQNAVQLTCQGGHMGQTVILAPIVVSRWCDPFQDPLVSTCPMMAERVKAEAVQPGTRVRVLESHTFLSSTSKYKGPSTIQHFIKTIVQHYRESNITVTGLYLDTDNCSHQFKSGTVIKALQLAATENKVTILTLNNVGGHNKSLSDGMGGLIKRAFDAATQGITPTIPQETPGSTLGDVLATYGNDHLSKAVPCPWKSRSKVQQILTRHFYSFSDDIQGLYPSPKFKVKPSKDGHGVTRGLTDVYTTRCEPGTNSTTFRNLFCACTACLAHEYQECRNPSVAASWQPLQMDPILKNEPVELEDSDDDDDDAGFDDDDGDGGLQVGVQFVEELGLAKGDFVAVQGDKGDLAGVWVAKIVEPLQKLPHEKECIATGCTFPKGSHVVVAYWLHDAVGWDASGSLQKTYRIDTTSQTFVMAHHILGRLKPITVLNNKGTRPLGNMIRFELADLSSAVQ